MFGYTPPGVANPWNDLTAGLGFSQTITTGSITVSQVPNTQNVQPSSAVQGCALGAAAGFAIAGAGIAFAVLTGGIGTPVAIAAIAVGVGGGCGIGGYLGNQYPGSTSQLFNSIVSQTGPIGSFLQALSVALQYAYPFVQFATDYVPYSFALLSYEPAFAAILAVPVTLTILMWTLKLAELFRGTGSIG